ncbi:MAG: hypothetical protein PWP15_618 [Methanothermococcus sp.]|jgi:hypothetical protein|uniref:DUF4855 domain-containing protein n=1 Tax=Methanococcaceae TaxID=2183 RepID=UPI00035D8CB8|nr:MULTISPECIES: DUF4855 domain-containing protein [Methanococcaceae]MDK2790111.1 hypothetical protein [Methanothermococcus sp.]MDK2988420.1 hypothetical protein [Methanothermococcus sp.]UXM85223.1 DUF4855 domain-containing protein [Methanococcus aeolicus]
MGDDSYTITWKVALFYYAGALTPTSQIPDFINEFNGVVILTNDEGESANKDALIDIVERFWEYKPGYQIIVEVPNPSGTCTYEEMKSWIDKIEERVADKVGGYYFVPEGAWTMLNASGCIDNVKKAVNYVKNTLNKFAIWIPVGDISNIEGSFNNMDLCQNLIGFTNIAPQPHYYMTKDSEMDFNKLIEFMQECKNRGWGVEFECDKTVLGNIENCGCKYKNICIRRAANYYCALNKVGNVKYIYHYFSNDIECYRMVKRHYEEHPCPNDGYSTC